MDEREREARPWDMRSGVAFGLLRATACSWRRLQQLLLASSVSPCASYRDQVDTSSSSSRSRSSSRVVSQLQSVHGLSYSRVVVAAGLHELIPLFRFCAVEEFLFLCGRNRVSALLLQLRHIPAEKHTDMDANTRRNANNNTVSDTPTEALRNIQRQHGC